MQLSPNGPRIREIVTPGRPQASGMAAVWLPWLVAPLFMAAPIGGCAVAERWRPPVAHAEGRDASETVRSVPVVPAGAVVTASRR